MSDDEIESQSDSGEAVEWKKFDHYVLTVDPNQDNRATEIKLCTFDRPHMRAFHCSWYALSIVFPV
eukprot:scaffold22661_cov200-Cylindrotheca_fusiformis.AAC.1